MVAVLDSVGLSGTVTLEIRAAVEGKKKQRQKD